MSEGRGRDRAPASPWSKAVRLLCSSSETTNWAVSAASQGTTPHSGKGSVMNGAKIMLSGEGPRPRGPGWPRCRAAGGLRTPGPASLPREDITVDGVPCFWRRSWLGCRLTGGHVFQIIFSDMSAAEMARLPKALQLEIMSEFQVMPEDVDAGGSGEKFGVLRRGSETFLPVPDAGLPDLLSEDGRGVWWCGGFCTATHLRIFSSGRICRWAKTRRSRTAPLSGGSSMRAEVPREINAGRVANLPA